MSADAAPDASRGDVLWTVFDRDAGGDGLPDAVQVGAAFDYHIVGPGEDPSQMTDAELSELPWFPCTRDALDGDGDSFRAAEPAPGAIDERVFASSDGLQWRFVWDAQRDVGAAGPEVQFILRARCIDAQRKTSETVYAAEPFTIAQ